MKFAPAVLLLFCLTPLAVAADSKGKTYATPEEAAANPDFAVQGEYATKGKGIQVIALGEGKFTVVTYQGGLPGAGWDGEHKDSAEGDAAFVKKQTDGYDKEERQSKTIGAKAPEGAVVLFDGTEETFKAHWADGAKITEDGLLQQGAKSKDTFGDFTLHMEFRTPFMPDARGQGRGNSGYYIQGRYEMQVLDSFGLEGLDNECGGIYKASKPQVNMCLPPLAWQTYDVDFTAAKFDDAGKKTTNAHVTVKHNDVVIHDNLELPGPTPGGVSGDEKNGPGPIFVQDHGNPVRFRNIWVVAK